MGEEKYLYKESQGEFNSKREGRQGKSFLYKKIERTDRKAMA